MKPESRPAIHVVERILYNGAIWIMLAFTGLAMVEVIRRHVFNISFMWQQDIVTLGVLSGVYLFFSHTERVNGHVSVTFVTEMLTRRGGRATSVARAFNLVSRVASVMFGSLVVYYALPLLSRYYEADILLPSQVLPLWPFFLFYVMGFTFYLVTCVFHLYRDIRYPRAIGTTDLPESA